MLILPLDHSEPYFATLGVMLYPAVDDADPPKARAYVAQVLAKTFRRFRDAGGSPPYDVLAPILMDAGEPLGDLQERWWGGRAIGELFKTFFALYNTNPALASWGHAIQIVELITENSEVKGSRTTLLEARDRFLTVATRLIGRSLWPVAEKWADSACYCQPGARHGRLRLSPPAPFFVSARDHHCDCSRQKSASTHRQEVDATGA